MTDSRASRPTIRDVARASGVSYQTVSRVLNDHPKVAPETRARVLRAMDQLGYHRNLAAQMLTTQRSGTIQVLTVDGRFFFNARLLDTASWDEYLAVYSECTLAELPQMLDRAAARMVEGIFLYAPRLVMADDDLLALCHGIPVVRRDFALASRKITWVAFDQVRATEIAVQHLLDLGHRRIATVTGNRLAINARVRYDTWLKVLRGHGLATDLSVEGDFTTIQLAVQSGYEGMRRLLESGAEFSAVLVANDNMSIGALHALREFGRRVPDDISLVSFDNAPHAQFMDPPLTTVNFDFDLQNRLGFQFLFELIQNPAAEPHQHILLPDLVVRASTRPLA